MALEWNWSNDVIKVRTLISCKITLNRMRQERTCFKFRYCLNIVPNVNDISCRFAFYFLSLSLSCSLIHSPALTLTFVQIYRHTIIGECVNRNAYRWPMQKRETKNMKKNKNDRQIENDLLLSVPNDGHFC